MTVYDIEERVHPEFEPRVVEREIAVHTEQIVTSVVLISPYEIKFEARVTRYIGEFSKIDVPGGKAIRFDRWRNCLREVVADHSVTAFEVARSKFSWKSFRYGILQDLRKRLEDPSSEARFRPLIALPIIPERFPVFIRLHPSQYSLDIFNPRTEW